MNEYNINEIFEKINELPEDEAVLILSTFTMGDLIKVLTFENVRKEVLNDLNENIQKLTDISNGLTKLFAELNTPETGSH